MLKNIVLIIAALIFLTNCGEKTKGANITLKAPETTADVQTKVERILDMSSSNVDAGARNGEVGELVRKQFQAMEMTVSDAGTDSISIEIDTVEDIGSSCKEGNYTASSLSISNVKKQFTSIPNLGRIKCVDADCTNMLLVIEITKSVYVGMSGMPYVKYQSAVPVIFLHQGDGKYIVNSAIRSAVKSETYLSPLKTLGLARSYCTRTYTKTNTTIGTGGSSSKASTATPINPVPMATTPKVGSYSTISNNTWIGM